MSLPVGGLLFLVLSLSVSARPTDEECKPLLTPASLADRSVMHGKVIFIMGFATHEVYKKLLEFTDSSTMNITSVGDNGLRFYEENKINGSCFSTNVNITIEGDVASMTMPDIEGSMHLLPSCDGCLTFSINSTMRNIEKYMRLMKLESPDSIPEISTKALYLLAKEETLKDSDLEQFKKQASCLGIEGEPSFHYDPKKGLCEEGQSVEVPFN